MLYKADNNIPQNLFLFGLWEDDIFEIEEKPFGVLIHVHGKKVNGAWSKKITIASSQEIVDLIVKEEYTD